MVVMVISSTRSGSTCHRCGAAPRRVGKGAGQDVTLAIQKVQRRAHVQEPARSISTRGQRRAPPCMCREIDAAPLPTLRVHELKGDPTADTRWYSTRLAA